MNDYSALRELLLSLPQMFNNAGEKACYQSLDTQLRELTAFRATLTPNEDKLESTRFRQELASIIHQSDFCRYVFEKPRGYAGDYVTQEMIWLGRTQGGANRYSGTTEAGRILNSLILDTENCRANEERIFHLRKLLATSGPRVASIGCGCSIELWDMPNFDTPDRDVMLLNQDEAALDCARKHLTSYKMCKVSYYQDNVLKFALRDPKNHRNSRDFVYAFGLLDYFPLKSAQRIVHGLWQYVAPGGTLVVTNAHPSNPTRLLMEYGGDWYLQYKDEETMYALALGLEGVVATTLQVDTYGIYQYLNLQKGAQPVG